jgi:hypothetical protein
MKARLKGCARCNGDLFPDLADEEGKTYACLQCGARIPAQAFVAVGPGANLRARTRVVVAAPDSAAAAVPARR